MAAPASPYAPTVRTGWASLLEMNRYHWFVFAVTATAWMLDCMDQQLFNLARQSAVTELLGPEGRSEVKLWATISTSVFLIGWAVGGLFFGIMGDRSGRVKTLSTTILVYSIFTGLSALSMTIWDFMGYRFLTGLGVGGVFAVAVALIAETVPDRPRPYTLGMLQALSGVGNCTAALIFIGLGLLAARGYFDHLTVLGSGLIKPWRIMFLVGIVPGLLVVLIQGRMHEPEKWKRAIAAGQKKPGFGELFAHPVWRRHALFGLLLAFSGVVGLWGIGFFSIDLQQSVFKKTFIAEAKAMDLDEAETTRYVGGQLAIWAGITSLFLNAGAAAGMLTFSTVTAFLGRKKSFAIAFVAAGFSTLLVFWKLKTFEDIYWMIPLMGFCQLALFGGFAIYLPELFPTRLRSTGTSFCYNVGRLAAAVGPFMLGVLTTKVFTAAEGWEEPMRPAGMVMCSVFLLGLLALPFLPETKDKPLPQE